MHFVLSFSISGFSNKAIPRTYQSPLVQALDPVVLEKKIFKSFSHHKPMADNDVPWAANFDPGSRLAGIIKELTKHCFTQNIKALGLMVSEKKIFFYAFFLF